ncbi:MAG: single-stranded DNA-binding protein [Candidatus Promineifilaceae bacterium]
MYQKLTIVGNVGRDPEMRYLPDGRPVTSLSVASNRKWTDKASGEQKEETTWFRVSVFGNQAEAVNQYVRKGRQVLVEGRLNPDSATGGPRLFTRQDGSVGASYEVIAETVRFLGSNGNSNGNADSGTAGYDAEEEEIPF